MPLIIPLGSNQDAGQVYTYAGLIAAQSGIAGQYSFQLGTFSSTTETWTARSGLATLNGDLDWVDYIGDHNWDVVSGAAQLYGGSRTAGGRVATPVAGADYQVTATIEEWTDTGGAIIFGPCARMQGDASLTFYCATLFGGTPDTLKLQRFVGGASTVLATSSALTLHAGMTVTTRVKGNVITGLFDGQPAATYTDPTPIQAGSYWGLQGYATAGNRIRVTQIAVGSVNRSIVPMLETSLWAFAGVH